MICKNCNESISPNNFIKCESCGKKGCIKCMPVIDLCKECYAKKNIKQYGNQIILIDTQVTL